MQAAWEIARLGGRALLVGGCVRDALLGMSSQDIDCEVHGLSQEALVSFFEQEALLFADPGAEYGPGGEGFMRLNLAAPSSWIHKVIANLSRAYEARGF